MAGRNWLTHAGGSLNLRRLRTSLELSRSPSRIFPPHRVLAPRPPSIGSRRRTQPAAGPRSICRSPFVPASFESDGERVRVGRAALAIPGIVRRLAGNLNTDGGSRPVPARLPRRCSGEWPPVGAPSRSTGRQIPGGRIRPGFTRASLLDWLWRVQPAEASGGADRRRAIAKTNAPSPRSAT